MMKTDNIDQLNSFLRGEISAVETYRQALDKVQDASIRGQLQDCLRSHQQRVDALTQYVRSLGGEPSEGSGAWGAFAKLVQGGAKVFGDKSAIAALEEGEDHGLKDYRGDLSKLDGTSRTFFQQQILPEQERTHQIVSSLKRLVERAA